MSISPRTASWLQASPFALIMVALVMIPLAIIIVVSFMDYGFAEIIPELTCSRCAKAAFNRSRFDLTSLSIGEEPMEEPKKKPESIVLEVQSLRHVMQAQFRPVEAVKPTEQEEQDNGSYSR